MSSPPLPKWPIFAIFGLPHGWIFEEDPLYCNDLAISPTY